VLLCELEWRGQFLAGTRFGSWDRKHENLGTSFASSSEIEVLVIFGELWKHVSPHGEQVEHSHTYGNRIRGPIPMRRQLVRFILLQVVENKDGTVGFVPVFSELGPSDNGATVAEDRGVGSPMFPRGDLFSILALEVNDVDLKVSMSHSA